MTKRKKNARALFHAKTRGGRYEILAGRDDDGTYSAEFFTSGKSSGRSSGYTKAQMIDRIRREIRDAREFDGINYTVVLDDIGVEHDRARGRKTNDAGSFALGAVGGAAAIIISNIVRGSPGVQYADLIAKAEKQANAGDFGQAKQTLAKADKAREKAVQQVGGLNDNIEIGDRFRGSLEQRIDRALASGSAGAAAQANPSATEAELTKRLKF